MKNWHGSSLNKIKRGTRLIMLAHLLRKVKGTTSEKVSTVWVEHSGMSMPYLNSGLTSTVDQINRMRMLLRQPRRYVDSPRLLGFLSRYTLDQVRVCIFIGRFAKIWTLKHGYPTPEGSLHCFTSMAYGSTRLGLVIIRRYCEPLGPSIASTTRS